MSAIRLALRQFRQHPTFALVTVLVLGLGTGAATTVFTIVDSVVLRPSAVRESRRARHVVGHQPREGAGARSDLAGELHGLPRAAGVQGRAGVVASRRQPGRPGHRSDARQHHRSERQSLRGPRREAASRRRLPRRRSVLRHQRVDLRDQRSVVAHALQRRPVDHRETAVVERHALHRGRRDAGQDALSGRCRRLAARSLGLQPAQPRRPLHGGGGTSRTGDDLRPGAKRGANTRRCGSNRRTSGPTRAGDRA